MITAVARTSNTVFHAYIEKALWEDRTIVYARMIGKPEAAKSIGAQLTREGSIVLKHGDYMYFNGSPGQCFYSRQQNFGVLTFASDTVFENQESTIIVGTDDEFIRDCFQRFLKNQPIPYLNTWDMWSILFSVGLISELQGYDCKGYRVVWNIEEIYDKLSDMVKAKTLPIKEAYGLNRVHAGVYTTA